MNYSATLKKTCETGASKKSKKFRGKKLCVTGLLMPAPIFYVVIDDFCGIFEEKNYRSAFGKIGNSQKQ